MSVDVIVNPVHPEGLHACRRVQALCARAGVPVRVRHTSIARPHADPAPEAALTVAIGGDGTLREVAGALVRAPSWRGALLPIPTGTADLFALNVGIRRAADGLRVLEDVLLNATPEGAGAGVGSSASSGASSGTGAASASATVRCDVGWARLERAGARTSAAVEQPFLVTAGIGHSGGVLLRTPGWAKALGGAAGYGVGALTRLAAEPLPVSLSTGEGVDRVDRDLGVWAAEFGNIAHVPYGITVFPHGGVRTGTLAGLVVAPRSRAVPSWGSIFRAGFLGGHERVADLDLARVTTARVRSRRPLPAHLDGEAVGLVTGLRVRVTPGALPIVVPTADM